MFYVSACNISARRAKSKAQKDFFADLLFRAAAVEKVQDNLYGIYITTNFI